MGMEDIAELEALPRNACIRLCGVFQGEVLEAAQAALPHAFFELV